MGIQAVFAENMRKYRKKAKLTNEDNETLALRKEQKQKVKAKVFESFTQICSMIDEV